MNRPSILHRYLLVAMAVASAICASAERVETTIKDGWEFRKEAPGGWTAWTKVRIPHDWAIYGPFSRDNDLQKVAVKQNGEEIATWKTGRTGGLPFIGRGQYRTTIELPDTAGRSVTLLFDGAMSNAVVRVNGREVTRWPHGYNSFHVCIDSVMRPGENSVEVDLENLPLSSRWYPGAGLYRNVHVINTSCIHIPVWGTQIVTPRVGKDFASVEVTTAIEGAPAGKDLSIVTRIISPDGLTVASDSSRYRARGQKIRQGMTIENPDLWSPSNPALYTARTEILYKGEVQDTHDTRFGIRSLEYVPDRGFYLNGELTKFRGVCNHHDLGPLGAAVNRSALRHQLGLLKDMGVNAIRTSHNMPAPELVELCDEMGIMLMVEPFDDWSHWPKSPNGYGRFFKEWAERDITNMVEHYRNNPSVVMWSSGNEVPSQTADGGLDELLMIQDLIHRLDPTRPVTNGMDRVPNTLNNGFAAATDIPGFNYKPQRYVQARKTLPQGLILGSETASTVSSRGVYHFPVTWKEHNVVMHPDKQSSSYDNETCAWSNTPDLDLAADEEFPWLLGQFVWTGFDYLGEPSPYDTDAWPSHSSYFGIIDLASLPKDRYYLYRSVWNRESPTLHILPHWDWRGSEGEVTPVFVYTSWPKAELFINGKSQGMREKNDSTLQNRFRLMWNETRYEPGEVTVVAYDQDGREAARKSIRTSGKPHHLVATPHRTALSADGDDMAYITVSVADKDGNPVPTDTREVTFEVKGAGTFEATANGDPTSLRSFQEPVMDLFSGAATAIVRSASTPGTLTFTARAKGLQPATITIPVE